MPDTFILPDEDSSILPSPRTLRGRTTPRGERLRAGDVLLGRYTVLSELGEGGMGVVYKCLDSVGGIEVALKCLPPELSRNEAEMEGIRENYALVARLHHSAISGLRNLEKDPDFGEYYLVMDLAEGEDLSVLLRRRRGAPMPLPEALSILRPLAAALDYAHGEKVLHRDVKPGNVKVLPAAEPGGAPRVQLLDFGLAAEVRSSLSRVSRKGHLGSSGTPSYMAPEQWEARPQGPATDQYALAVVAYEMLAGVRPFDADDPDILRRAVLSREPDPVPGLSRRANAALLRGLAKDPAARFPSCTAFVNEVGRAVPASHRGSAGTPRPTRRRLALAAAAVLAVGALGAVLLFPTRGGGEVGPHAESAKLESHAESAESAEQGGEAGPLAEGAAERSEAGGVSRAEPGGASSPSEPPEGAPLKKLQAARDSLADALAKRRAEGWPDDSSDSSALLAAIARLDGRIEVALDAEEAADRAAEEARLAAASAEKNAAARAAVQEARDLRELGRLRNAAAVNERDVAAFRKWNDGEFGTQFDLLDRNRRALDGFSKASDLAKARESALAVQTAALWIKDNAPLREEIASIESAIGAVLPELSSAEASRYARKDLNRADTARKDAERLRDAGEFAKAKEKFESAAAQYREALASAKTARGAAKAREALVDAEAAKIREDWSAVLSAAEKALEWDAGNEAAKALKAEAEKKAAIASEDDGFTNHGEFQGGTASRDAGSRPSRFSFLRVRSIDVEPFPYSFNGSKMRGADGEYKFAVKDASGRDWYVKKGQGLAKTGFVLQDYSSAMEERKTSNGVRKMEIFTLRFVKGDDQVVMKAGSKPESSIYKVSFVCAKDAEPKVYEAKRNETFDFDGDTFKLLSVDRKAGTAKLERTSNKEIINVPSSDRTGADSGASRPGEPRMQETGSAEHFTGPGDAHAAGDRWVPTVAGVSVPLRWCPPGSFTMGSDNGDSDERPTIRVVVPNGFWMGETEVTQELWQKVMGENPSYNRKGGSYPVERVSWNDSVKFVKTLNERAEVNSAGLRFAIPTEAQWEYACRANGTGDYGRTKEHDEGGLDDMGWYSSNSRGATHSATEPRTPNAWGLLNMHGNVWEWCANVYRNHPDGSLDNDAEVRDSGDSCLLRGGGYWNDARRCRSASRITYPAGNREWNRGLRLLAFQDGK